MLQWYVGGYVLSVTQCACSCHQPVSPSAKRWPASVLSSVSSQPKTGDGASNEKRGGSTPAASICARNARASATFCSAFVKSRTASRPSTSRPRGRRSCAARRPRRRGGSEASRTSRGCEYSTLISHGRPGSRAEPRRGSERLLGALLDQLARDDRRQVARAEAAEAALDLDGRHPAAEQVARFARRRSGRR